MPTCKFCQQEINWVSVNGTNVPKNADGTDHKTTCKKPTQTKIDDGAGKAKVTRSTEERKADLEAFIAVCANAKIGIDAESAATVWCRL